MTHIIAIILVEIAIVLNIIYFWHKWEERR
jgi:hypothetical protein